VLNIAGQELKTCPQYYANTRYYQSIRDDLEDYRRGAIGNVDDLAINRLAALRVLDRAEQHWQSDQEQNIREQSEKKRRG